ncbi:electron transport complex subunit RsxG [Aliidiomarina taiwanensis]|uniref:Ion-translocating oxidoreductase complex subunit G n=2 Tax=Aliidiomarina taiwanensis TaxID=946228 RepID=A0A432X273_9GAMM|nr:electron transport complex subunit RsxG [Aliidiomarina taiwanensis]
MRRNGLILAVFALVATGLLMFTQHLTADRIAAQQRNELMRTLHELIPDASYNNDLYADCTQVHAPEALGSQSQQPIYRARLHGQPVALAIRTTAPDGYSGDIHLLVAIANSGTVLGARVLEHRETPGLGDKIDVRRSDWIESFANEQVQSATDPRWEVRRDGGAFDQFSGATITPRAVINAIQRTVVWANQQQAALFALPVTCQSNSPLQEEPAHE